MKKKFLYQQPKTKVFEIRTEGIVCFSGNGSGDRNDYEQDDSWTDE